jgi:hypothetical protein
VIVTALLLALGVGMDLGVGAPAAAQTSPAPEPTEELLAFGDAPFLGSTRSFALRQPVVTMAAAPDGGGYWVVAADGGIFSFGTAPFLGSTGGIPLHRPIVGMAPTRSGRGYWLVASDGGIFSFGDAPFLGSTGGIALHRPIVGMAPTRSGRGYWLVASDGGIFSFGDAPFLGSTGGVRLHQPIAAMAATPSGGGYWLAASDGGIFTFGNAPFLGSAGGIPLAGRVVALAPRAGGQGYWMAVQRRPVLLPGSPAAWLLADRTTGQALLEHRADERRRPASTSKMLTALVAVRRLPPGTTIPISARSAAVPPTEAGARTGEVWSMTDALHGLLLPSGNDIAYAIAERVSGTVEAFGTQLQVMSNELGLSTASTWRDPAGFDSAIAVGGGNWSTARDLARVGRAVLDDPVLARIVRTPAYTYQGPYGSPRTVTNSNRLLTTDPSVTGVKTGSTAAAGQCLVASASRAGRQVVTVVLGAADRYAATTALLDRTPAAA